MLQFDIKTANVSASDINELEYSFALIETQLNGLAAQYSLLVESMDHRLDAEHEKVRQQLAAARQGLEIAKNIKDPVVRDMHIAKVKENRRKLEQKLNMLRKEQDKHEEGYYTNETPRQKKDRTNAVRSRKRRVESAKRKELKAQLRAKRQTEKEAKLATYIFR